MRYAVASDYRNISLVTSVDDVPFRPPLHAYAPGSLTTCCGLGLAGQMIMHHIDWNERPRDLAICGMCAAVAEA